MQTKKDSQATGEVGRSASGNLGNPSILAMSSLGKIGRFGNQLMQYFFLRACAERSGASIQCPDWLGRKLFGLSDPPVTARLTPAIERWEEGNNMFDEFPAFIKYIEKLAGAPSVRIGVEALKEGARDVDLCGHFQYHTRHYRPFRDSLRAWVQPVPGIKADLETGLAKLRALGRTVVAIHLRQGDFKKLPHFGFTLCVPPRWWCDWLDGIWNQLDRPVLFLCSDDLDFFLPQFAKYRPASCNDLGIPWGSDQADLRDYIDFYVLSQADVVGISNSTYSFIAAMLNQRARLFLRPHWDFATRFCSFDPWDSPPLLYHRGPPPRLFKSLRGALAIAQATGGAPEMVRCFFAYALGMGKLKTTTIACAIQASGVSAAHKK